MQFTERPCDTPREGEGGGVEAQGKDEMAEGHEEFEGFELRVESEEMRAESCLCSVFLFEFGVQLSALERGFLPRRGACYGYRRPEVGCRGSGDDGRGRKIVWKC